MSEYNCYLVNKEGNQNKFWQAELNEDGLTVTAKWGRIGTSGQTSTKTFSHKYKATNHISNKMYEKIRKKYTRVDKNDLAILNAQGSIIGSGNKIDNVMFVEVEDGQNENPQYGRVTAERLQNPECKPGIIMTLRTRKSFDNRNEFLLLLYGDSMYDVKIRDGFKISKKIDGNHDLSEIAKKIMQSVGFTIQNNLVAT